MPWKNIDITKLPVYNTKYRDKLYEHFVKVAYK